MFFFNLIRGPTMQIYHCLVPQQKIFWQSLDFLVYPILFKWGFELSKQKGDQKILEVFWQWQNPSSEQRTEKRGIKIKSGKGNVYCGPWTFFSATTIAKFKLSCIILFFISHQKSLSYWNVNLKWERETFCGRQKNQCNIGSLYA